MATITPRKGKKGTSYRVLVRMMGVDDCATFPTKALASAWATKREAEILAGARGFPTKQTVSDAIDRFIEDVCPTRPGRRWEEIRLRKFQRGKIAQRPLSRLSSEDMARWRDDRLEEVSPSSVARELKLWGALLSVCVKEWGWIPLSPLKGVKSPKEPPPRRRGVSQEEIEALMDVGGTSVEAFLFGIETAMRAGEILGLTWGDIDLQKRIARLPKSKNGDSREVPLSTAAVRILESKGIGTGRPFAITSESLDVLFRRARDIADCPTIKTLHFHDSRSEGITRLSKVFSIQDLARIVGHRNLNSLMFYYHSSAEELAKKLA